MQVKKPIDKLKELYKGYEVIKYPLTGGAGAFPPYFKQSSTTNGLTKCIIAYIRLNGWQAERINTTGRMLDNTKIVEDVCGIQRQIGSKKYIPGTGTKGSADISATISGKSVKIEIKNEKTKDRQSEYQRSYQSVIDLSGGVYFIATNLEMFISWFDGNFKPHQNLNEVYKYFINNKIII